MAQKPEYKVLVSAQKATGLDLFRCPRCFKFHDNRWNTEYEPDKKEDMIKYPKHRFCNKCEDFLWGMAIDGSDFLAAKKVQENCESLGRRRLK